MLTRPDCRLIAVRMPPELEADPAIVAVSPSAAQAFLLCPRLADPGRSQSYHLIDPSTRPPMALATLAASDEPLIRELPPTVAQATHAPRIVLRPNNE